MPNTSRTIRLFVSSTFSDMKVERDVLQRTVFPKLQQLCLSKGLRFQAIDLRWGVSEEAGKDNRTMRICLRELKRCQEGDIKPNFLVLLGDRYGWRPLPETLSAEVFEELLKNIEHRTSNSERRNKATADQVSALMRTWYRRDDNAVPAEYVLQPRTGRFEDFAVWQAEVEMPLLAALTGAPNTVLSSSALSAPLREDLSSARIGLSATHQEIIYGALALPKMDARKHVHAFRRRIVNPPSAPHPAFTDCLPDSSPDADGRRRLDALCAELDDHLGPANVHPYEVPWRDKGAFSDTELAAFATEVYEHLRRVIEAQIADLEEVSPEEQEDTAHRDFAEERRAGFIGRLEPMRRIREYLSSGPDQPLAIVGPAGSGKSALMAQAIAETDHRSSVTDHHPHVLFRFIGVTPGSSDLIELLRDLVARIRTRYPPQIEQGGTGIPPVASEPSHEPKEKGPDDRDIPSEINPLTNAFHEALGRATAERPLWLFLDALNQFRDAKLVTSLSWLPQKLPEHVRIVVSAALPAESGTGVSDYRSPNTDYRTQLSRNLSRLAPGTQTVRLDPLAPSDGAALLDRWLDAAGRTLQKSQRRPILDAFAVEGNALWLRVAAEEAARWPAWHKPGPLPPALPDLLATVLQRLSRGEEHGEVIVKRALGYLAAARHGLAEDEVIGVLGKDSAVMADVIARSPTERAKPEAERIKALPVAVWVRLHGDIAFYLTERRNQGASLFGFYHRSFGEAVRAYCLPDAAARLPLHETMADWFGAQPWFLPPAGEDGQPPRAPERSDPANGRKASELPFHLHRVAELNQDTDRWDSLVEVLCDLDCVETKARSALVYELMTDYNAALAQLPEFREENERLTKHDAAMFAYNQALREYAKVRCDWWFAHERGETRPEPPYPSLPVELQDDAQHVIPEETYPRAAQLRQFFNFVAGCLGDLARYPHDTIPFAYNWAKEGSVAENTDQQIQDYRNPWLKRLPRPPKPPLRPHSTRLFEGHEVRPRSLSFCLDGRQIALGNADNLHICDLVTGQCLRTIEGHNGAFNCVCMYSDGKCAVSGSSDGTLRVWDLETGQCLHALDGHNGSISRVSVSPDGHLAISIGQDDTLRVWDLESGRYLRTIEGYNKPVWRASVCTDGRRVVGGSGNRTLGVWDIETGQCLRSFERDASVVTAVSVSPDSLHAVSGSHDKALRVWDLETGQCLRTLEGHNGLISCVSVSPDGRRAVSASHDKTLRLWNLENGQCLQTFEGHDDSVSRVCVSPDGRRAVSICFYRTLFWDLQSGQCHRTLEGHTDRVDSVSVSPDGRHTVSGSRDHTLRVWKTESGQSLRTLEGHTGWVESVSVCPDGRRAVSGAGALFDSTLRFWDLQTGECLRILTEHNKAVCSVSVCPDGRRVVSAGRDKKLRVWDLETGQCLRIRPLSVVCVRVCSNGRQAVLSSWDNRLRVWDLETDECLLATENKADDRSVSICPDGSRAVSGSRDRTLRVWNLETGECLHTLGGHNIGNSYLCVSVSPDGRRAVSSSDGYTMRVWDLESGQCMAAYHAGSVVCSLAFSPSGNRIVAGTLDGQMHFLTPVNFPPSGPPIITAVRLWNFKTPSHWITVCRWLVGNILGNRKVAHAAAPGRWDNHLTAPCPWCGQRFRVRDEMIGQQITCPLESCGKPLQLNPFVVDKNRS